MDLSRRRANPAFPTNRLAARGLIRDLAELILPGEDISKVSVKKFIDSYEAYLILNNIEYDPESLSLPKTTFKRWVKGDSFPQNKWLITFFTPLSEMRNRWEIRKNFTCRLQRYLACLDLKWMSYEKGESEAADNLAESILKNIHQDWRLDNYLDIAIRSPFDKGHLGNPYAQFARSKNFYDKKYANNPFSLELKGRGYIYPRIDFQEVVLYQLDSKISVIPHLFWLALHLKPDGAQIHTALIFDLIVAVRAAKHLNFYRLEQYFLPVPSKITTSEVVGQFCLMFFTSNFYELQDENYDPNMFGVSPPSESLMFEFEEIFKPSFEKYTNLTLKEDAFENLFNLKTIFFQTLSTKTGLSNHEVLTELNTTEDYINPVPYVIKFDGSEFLDQ